MASIIYKGTNGVSGNGNTIYAFSDGAYTWQVITADTTAQDNYAYLVDDSGLVIISPPSSPNVGDSFLVMSINGVVAFDFKINGEYDASLLKAIVTVNFNTPFRFFYTGATYGWACEKVTDLTAINPALSGFIYPATAYAAYEFSQVTTDINGNCGILIDLSGNNNNLTSSESTAPSVNNGIVFSDTSILTGDTYFKASTVFDLFLVIDLPSNITATTPFASLIVPDIGDGLKFQLNYGSATGAITNETFCIFGGFGSTADRLGTSSTLSSGLHLHHVRATTTNASCRFEVDTANVNLNLTNKTTNYSPGASMGSSVTFNIQLKGNRVLKALSMYENITTEQKTSLEDYYKARFGLAY